MPVWEASGRRSAASRGQGSHRPTDQRDVVHSERVVDVTYRATAHRDDDWWIVEVADIGVTQARSISEVYRMASDLVYAMTDVKAAEVEVHFVGGVFDEIAQVRQMQERAEEQMAEASAAMRRMVATLRDAGLSGSDIARVLCVSRQRVSQLSRVGTASSRQTLNV